MVNKEQKSQNGDLQTKVNENNCQLHGKRMTARDTRSKGKEECLLLLFRDHLLLFLSAHSAKIHLYSELKTANFIFCGVSLAWKMCNGEISTVACMMAMQACTSFTVHKELQESYQERNN